ncbi:MAG: hypothetical protein IPN01_12255 [Deltaproteobacteria bacterium]|nr:hypothetical protein [Deltaproteobacteria bacterium]
MDRDKTQFGVVFIYFGVCREVPSAMVIILLAEVKYPDLVAGTLKLPEGWQHLVDAVRDGANAGAFGCCGEAFGLSYGVQEATCIN